MKYVAFLRGINVGGKCIMKMAAVRRCLEDAGFKQVTTYIQSGNVIVDTDERMPAVVTRRIEAALSVTFAYEAKVVLRSQAQLKSVVAGAPAAWSQGDHFRRYVAFLRPPVTARQAVREVPVKDGVDTISAGTGVLYMSTLLTALNKSALTKLVSRPIYQDMTIRNHSTCVKILALMDRR
jgi:uncharacterized protein (DUF1697 family)